MLPMRPWHQYHLRLRDEGDRPDALAWRHARSIGRRRPNRPVSNLEQCFRSSVELLSETCQPRHFAPSRDGTRRELSQVETEGCGSHDVLEGDALRHEKEAAAFPRGCVDRETSAVRRNGENLVRLFHLCHTNPASRRLGGPGDCRLVRELVHLPARDVLRHPRPLLRHLVQHVLGHASRRVSLKRQISFVTRVHHEQSW